MGDKIEQETSMLKNGGKEGEEEVTLGQKEARAAPSTVSTASAVPTVPSSSSDPLGRSHTQTVLDQLSDSTFDFGVVAVYSCPNSCSSFSRTDTANHHHQSHRDSHSHSKDEKSSNSSSRSENISSVTTPSHHSTASAGASAGASASASASACRVCYEYTVVQPPADF